jgi:hypothetical protein
MQFFPRKGDDEIESNSDYIKEWRTEELHALTPILKERAEYLKFLFPISVRCDRLSEYLKVLELWWIWPSPVSGRHKSFLWGTRKGVHKGEMCNFSIHMIVDGSWTQFRLKCEELPGLGFGECCYGCFKKRCEDFFQRVGDKVKLSLPSCLCKDHIEGLNSVALLLYV